MGCKIEMLILNCGGDQSYFHRSQNWRKMSLSFYSVLVSCTVENQTCSFPH